ncbi:MAG: UDP-glucose/GDP-mannose dehydrogenase family protein [Spirochaetales bacterium]|nr:UDP-glucose/GDP-mannose dehydrogenase family protein [Spirochaetales bacterium]
MSQKICVVGTGYVGLIASVGLADFGNTVTGVDLNEDKINKLKEGISPIYEPGVEDYLRRNLDSGRLKFTTGIDYAIKDSTVVFIAVGTPENDNGEANLSYVESVVNSIADNLNDYKVIVTKSTVPVGTNRWIYELLKEKTGHENFDVVSNPEFLREGRATQDFFHPDRTVLGCESEKAKEIMFNVYRSLNLISVPFVWCNLETAELIKYASNAFLATKITFINEIANLAEAVGADIHQISKSMGMDGRISPKFLHPGPGYGGSCFPKDTKAVAMFGKKYGVTMNLIESVIDTNDKQKARMVEKLKTSIGDIKGKTIAVLGLAFKQQTDDIRETPALTIVDEILKAGGKVQAHDPKAMDNFAKIFPDIMYCHTAYDAAKNADAVVIVTEWNEYRGLDLIKLKHAMKGNFILDTRNLLDPEIVVARGFIYEGVGRK